MHIVSRNRIFLRFLRQILNLYSLYDNADSASENLIRCYAVHRRTDSSADLLPKFMTNFFMFSNFQLIKQLRELQLKKQVERLDGDGVGNVISRKNGFCHVLFRTAVIEFGNFHLCNLPIWKTQKKIKHSLFKPKQIVSRVHR